MSITLSTSATLTEEQKKELDLIERLKPYLGHCLTLNHDLNNPLAGIIGYTEFLQEESNQLSDEHKEFVDQIMTCAERMKRVLENLCKEKIALSTGLDLSEVVATYEPFRKPLD